MSPFSNSAGSMVTHRRLPPVPWRSLQTSQCTNRCSMWPNMDKHTIKGWLVCCYIFTDYYQHIRPVSWQQKILTICQKCIPTAWTDRSSRRGSTLGGGQRNPDIASIINKKREECADCHPRLQDMIIRLKINRQSLCGWRVNGTIHKSCGSNVAVIRPVRASH